MPSFTITIDDPDALDAINAIIAANGTGEKPEAVIAGMLIPQLVAMREAQLTNAAQAKVKDDPALAPFLARKAAKIQAEADAAAAAEAEALVVVAEDAKA